MKTKQRYIDAGPCVRHLLERWQFPWRDVPVPDDPDCSVIINEH